MKNSGHRHNLLGEMANNGIIRSFAEGRRLVFGGGVSVNGEKVDDPNHPLIENDSVLVGNRHSFIVGESE